MSDNKPLSPLDEQIVSLAKQLLSCNQKTMYDLYDFYQDKKKKSRSKCFIVDTDLKKSFDDIRTLLKNHKQDREQVIMKMLTLLNMLQYGTAQDLKNTEYGNYVDEDGNIVNDDTSQYEIMGEVHYVPNPDEAEEAIALHRLKIIIKYLEREFDKLLDSNDNNIEETTIINETTFTTDSDIVKEFVKEYIADDFYEKFSALLNKLNEKGYITTNNNGAYKWMKQQNEYAYFVHLLYDEMILKDDGSIHWQKLQEVFNHEWNIDNLKSIYSSQEPKNEDTEPRNLPSKSKIKSLESIINAVKYQKQ